MFSKPSAATLAILALVTLAGVYVAAHTQEEVAAPHAEAATTGSSNPPAGGNAQDVSADRKTLTPGLSKSGGGSLGDLLHLNYADFTDEFRVTVGGLPNPVKKDGILILRADGAEIDRTKITEDSSGSYEWDQVTLDARQNRGPAELTVTYQSTPAEGEKIWETKTPLTVDLDTEGPILDTARLTGVPEAGLTLVLTFDESDLQPSEVKHQNFTVNAMTAEGTVAAPDLISSDNNVSYGGGNSVRLFLGRIKVGSYQVIVKDTLTDLTGNKAGGGGGADQNRLFSSESAAEQGERVEFPEFLPTARQPVPERKANPGDRVETRVARLYYFRDAQRVAQVINRIAKSYNHAAVTQAQRRAETARVNANKLTDERRSKERAAIEAAKETRRQESQLEETTREIERLQRLQSQPRSRRITGGTITASSITTAKIESAYVNRATLNRATLNSAAPGDPTVTPDRARRGNEVSGGTLAGGEVRGSTLNRGTITGGTISGGTVNGDTIIGGIITGAVIKDGEITNGTIIGSTVTGGSLNDVPLNRPDSPPTGAARTDGAISNGTITNGDLKDAKLSAGTIVVGTMTGVQVELAGNGGADAGSTSEIEGRIRNLQSQANSIQSNINATRQNEIRKNEESLKAQAAEDRAVENQFRADVAAAHEDPDYYAPSKKDSVDPVAQVSISVIGEGLLHLRGPMHGINKIRRMIDQIDTPVGQVKVIVNTVQINGEKGDKMEVVAGRIEGNIDLARFLTAQSLAMLRRAVQIEAAQVAMMTQEGHYQVDRDRRYLYNFFGRDFIDELYAMDSEFLRTQNKLLSLHSMDTISLNRAMFILALAKNDIRQRILARFIEMVKSDLPQAEWDFRRSSDLHPHKTRNWLPFSDKTRIEENTLERVYRNAQQRYHFRSLLGFFDMDPNCGPLGDIEGADGLSAMGSDTINSTQRTFLRLAQIFKSQMIAEEEFKQRIIERALVEDDRQKDLDDEDAQRATLRSKVLESRQKATLAQLSIPEVLQNSKTELAMEIQRFRNLDLPKKVEAALAIVQKRQFSMEVSVLKLLAIDFDTKKDEYEGAANSVFTEVVKGIAPIKTDFVEVARNLPEPYASKLPEKLEGWVAGWMADKEKITKNGIVAFTQQLTPRPSPEQEARARTQYFTSRFLELKAIFTEAKEATGVWEEIGRLSGEFDQAVDFSGEWNSEKWQDILRKFSALDVALTNAFPDPPNSLRQKLALAWIEVKNYENARRSLANLDGLVKSTRRPLSQKKLLDYLIDEREEKFIELREGTRSYIAAVDNYLKRLAIALEDDFKVQFYDPAFVRIRSAARAEAVQLGAVERTSILMNNRAMAIVRPNATMEFDLPKRDIVIVEALDGAKALAQDYGALLNDPTFLAAFQMMGGATQPGTIKNMVPGLGSTTDEHNMGLNPSQPGKSPSALQSLVPDPAIYKFETGTAFEIRPVIQPDGDSIVYDFNYMYTTNIREPVRADEKHLGRIKRHFIDTQVQTSSFEMREVSRYQVALKASRTSRGVPLFEDIPGLGVLFRPAPSAESSLQQNIILAQSTVYPTLFDLMGLRWARHVVDLDHTSLRDSEHRVRGRNTTIEDSVFDKTSDFVDKFLGIEPTSPHYRPDLYRPQRQPSPYHPNGYIYDPENIEDPTGESFRVPDRRPQEMQSEPPYDKRFRRPYQYEQLDQAPEELQLRPADGTESRLNRSLRRGGRQASVAPASYSVEAPSRPRMRRLPPVQ